MSERKALLIFLTSMIIFGSNGIIAGRISMNSYEIVYMRTILGSAVLTACFFMGGNRLTCLKHKKQTLCLAAAGIAMVSSWMFQFEAYEHIGVSVATLLYYCGPVMVMLMSPVLFGERLTAIKLLCLGAVAAGVLLVNGRTGGGGSVFGIFCGFMSAVMYAVMIAFNKQAKDIEGVETAMIQLIVAFIFTSCFVGIKQGFHIDFSASDIVPILTIGIVNTGLTCYMYFVTIKYLRVQTVALFSYVDLLASVVLSFIFLGESLTPIQLVGAVLIMGGALMGEMTAVKEKVKKC